MTTTATSPFPASTMAWKDLRPTFLAQWKSLNMTPDSFLKPIGLSLPAGEKGRLLIEQVSTRPTCDINGIIGGYTGEGSKTVIPAEASAKISFRLVVGQDPEKIRQGFRDYVTARLPADCKAEFTDHSTAPGIALDWNMKPLAAAKRALTEEWGKDALLVGCGGSIPIVSDFKRTLGLDTVLVGFGLDDDNIHSPNEKYDLKSFHKGIRSWARILAAFAERRAEGRRCLKWDEIGPCRLLIYLADELHQTASISDALSSHPILGW